MGTVSQIWRKPTALAACTTVFDGTSNHMYGVNETPPDTPDQRDRKSHGDHKSSSIPGYGGHVATVSPHDRTDDGQPETRPLGRVDPVCVEPPERLEQAVHLVRGNVLPRVRHLNNQCTRPPFPSGPTDCSGFRKLCFMRVLHEVGHATLEKHRIAYGLAL